MTIDLLAEGDDAGWDAYVARHPEATVYHTTAWRNVSAAAFGHIPYFLVARESGVIAGVFPLFLVDTLLGRRLVSVPLRDRGGILADTSAIGAGLLEHAKELTRSLHCKYLEIKMVSTEEEYPGHGMSFQRHFLLPVLDISGGPDAVWNGFSKTSIPRAIRKAEKTGMTYTPSMPKASLDEFYSLFLRVRRRLGVPPYGAILFEKVFEEMVGKGIAQMHGVEYQGRLVAGMVTFDFAHRRIVGYVASEDRLQELRPVNKLYWEVIKDGCAKGIKVLDFGTTSPEAEGLLAFKLRWGAHCGKNVPIGYYFPGKSTIIENDSNKPKFALVRRVFQLTPIPVLRVVGPMITRQLS